jgi:hypothetical protein
MRNLPQSNRSLWCRSAQDTRAAVRDLVGGAAPELRWLGSLQGYQQPAGRGRWAAPQGCCSREKWLCISYIPV